MISRITPEALEKFSWKKYTEELKQDFLHMRPGGSYQFLFVHDYPFPKGGSGPLFVAGSNLKAYWQADELKELESDYRHTYLHGTATLKEDKNTLELDIKRGGIIKANKHKIQIAFRDIFRAIGRGDSLRVTFKGHKKKNANTGQGQDDPQSVTEKVDYLKRKPKEVAWLIEQATTLGVLPEDRLKNMQGELRRAQNMRNIHKMVEWYQAIERMLIEVMEEDEEEESDLES